MRYVFRADASLAIGTGHVMRSSAIAEELIARGEEVIFVGLISDLPWVADRIGQLGFTEIFENPMKFVSKRESDVLLLDSYEIDIQDPFIASERWMHIITIVDEQTPNYDCDLRIHPGLDASWVGDSKVPILAGPNFIPFRSSLSRMAATTNQNNLVPKIAVVAGGSDPYKLVFEIASVLAQIRETFDVLLFSNSLKVEDFDSRFQVIEIGSRLDDLTQNADIVFTTSSTSSLEFLARGLCVGVACAVDNQKQYYESLGRLGAAAQIGFRNSSNEWVLDFETIHALVTSKNQREILKLKSASLIDFNGAGRIVDAIQAV